MRGWQAGRQALASGSLEDAQRQWDALLPSQPGEAFAVVLARPCAGELTVALAARAELAPVWVTGPEGDCHGLLWGLFESEADAREAGARVPARYLEGEPEVVRIWAPLAALRIRPPSVHVDEALVDRGAPMPEAPPPPATPSRADRALPPPPPPASRAAPPELDPSLSASELFALGNAAYARGDYAAAIAAFEASLQRDPANPRTLNNLGTAQLVDDQPEDAERSFRSAVNLDPSYARAWLNLGTALYAQGQGSEAVPMLERAVELDLRNLDAHSNLAALLVELRRWQAARRVLQEALVIFPAETVLLRQLEQVEEQIALRGDVDGTETDADSDDIDAAGNAAARPPPGHAAVRGAGSASPCAADLSRARRILHAGKLFEEGRSAYARGQHDSAEWAFERALECDPTSPAILNHLGAARLAAGRASSAAGAFELAIHHDGAFLEARVNLALAEFQMGRCDSALAGLRELRRRDPSSGEAAFQLGRMLYRCGRTGEATASLAEARSLLPADRRPQELLDRIASEQIGAPR
jgi:tetratricopeptide (TPR) repeat protein